MVSIFWRKLVMHVSLYCSPAVTALLAVALPVAVGRQILSEPPQHVLCNDAGRMQTLAAAGRRA